MISEPGAQAAAARASSADRERVIELLKAAFVQDRLTRDEFDARVGQALASRTHAELAAVTADLPAELIEPLPHRPPARARARARARGRLSMNSAVTGGACVMMAANAGMMAALFTGSWVALVLVGVFTVVGTILAIGAMIVAP